LFVSYGWLKRRLPAEVPAEEIRSGRQWLASSVPLGMMEGMRILQSELSILLVGMVTSPAIVGLLRIASVTATTAAAPTVVVTQISLPIMARLHAQGDHQRLQKTVTGVAHAQFFSVLALSLPLLIVPGWLISLAFGSAYAPAADALRIILIGQIANAAFGPNIWVLNMTHHEKHVARAMGIALAMNAVLVPLLAIQWGVVGAAAGLLASMLCWNAIAWRDARRLLGIETSILHWPWRAAT
jgi:O-antigen/teichoic acid export membrane protein